ncbi:hypothetical protein [Kushneria konosiri]|uniref:Pentapeptide MXKDX repeat protein n=1 Tax=Kushneria konosiri TaxID=698828 RepID=A0A2Z2H789_9GAMM|nr:hypothetical protein [Kushneria konosiri]ARS53275.1 hypothetical protein B9G99_10760 [Kushneria konosiri]
MKAIWLAAVALTLAATPALASDMDADDGQMQSNQAHEQHQQSAPSSNTEAEPTTDKKDQDGRTTRQSDDMSLDIDQKERAESSHGDMSLEDDKTP